MRKGAIILAVAFQLAVLGWMAAEREWVVRTGRTVYLRTAPVDPNDPMRGDYVRLDYEIATVPKALCRDGVAQWFDRPERIDAAQVRDRRIYAEIRLGTEGVAELVSVSDQPPKQQPYLRGRANAIHLNTLDVRFGVEAFFMQQGKAKEFEDQVRGEKAGVPLNMELKVGRRGLAVLSGYRWEPLGITVQLDRPSPTRASTTGDRIARPGLRGLTVELKNHGTTPQAIASGPPEQRFRLIPAATRGISEDQIVWRWVGEDSNPATPRNEQIKVLQPGETHRVHIDLTREEWFVRKVRVNEAPGPAVPIETLTEDWNASFRIEYVPPDAASGVALPHAELIRQVRLRSRMFNAAGSID